MSLVVTRRTVTFVCQLQAAGYPHRAYFSYTYYEIGEWDSTAVWKSLDKCCLYYLTLCDLFAVARSHTSWPRWMDMCWMYSVKFFVAASFVNRMFYCFPCLCLYDSFLFIIIIYLLCVMLVYSIYCIVVSLLLFSPPNRWTLSCKYFLPPCVD